MPRNKAVHDTLDTKSSVSSIPTNSQKMQSRMLDTNSSDESAGNNSDTLCTHLSSIDFRFSTYFVVQFCANRLLCIIQAEKVRKRKRSLSVGKKSSCTSRAGSIDVSFKQNTEEKATRKQPLRRAKRDSLISTAENIKEKKNQTARKDGRKKLEEKIRDEAPVKQFNEGEIVLGTIPGYAPWPARVLKIIEETIYIEFFGTGQLYVNLFEY